LDKATAFITDFSPCGFVSWHTAMSFFTCLAVRKESN